jgi:hypothetical protein
MTVKRRRFIKGIKLSPDTTALTEEGEVKYDDTANKLQYQDDTATRSVVSEDGTQVLTNKTIDGTSATGTNTVTTDADQVTYDNTTSGLTASNLQAAIDELDTRLEGQDEASEIQYDNTTSGLTATNVQDAIDENDGRLDTIEGSYVESFNTRTGAVTPQASDYDANQVDYDNATSGLTATDVQAAIDEVEGRVDTIEGATYVNSFNTRTGDVIPAASDYDANQIDYDNTTTGFTATDVQAAIDEADANFDAHTTASSGVHGVTGDVVGTTDTQDLSNKTFTDAITLETQVTTPATPASGDKKFYAKTDGQLYTLDDAGNEVPVGSGQGGELNFYENGSAEPPVSTADFTTGNNATFDGGGTLQGTFSISSTSADIINGDNSFKLVLNASAGTSVNYYVASTVIDIPQGYRGRTLGVKFQYKYDGADNDIAAVIKDNTNGTILTNGTELLESSTGANNIAKEFNFTFFCPSNCQQIKFGFQVEAQATGSEELIWDDVVISPNLLTIGEFDNITDWEAFTATGSWTTNTTYQAFKRRVGDSLEVQVQITTSGSPTAVDLLVNLPSGLTIDGNKINAVDNGTLGQVSAYNSPSGSRYGGQVLYNTSTDVSLYYDAPGVGENIISPISGAGLPFGFGSGDKVFATFRVPIQGWSATSTNVVSATDNVQPVRYTTNAGQSIPNNTSTIVNFEDVDFDSDVLVTTGAGWQYLAPRKGVIAVSACLQFTTVSTTIGSISVFKNGVEHSLLDRQAINTILSGSDLISVEKDDIIDIRTTQSSGGSVSLITASEFNYVTIEYVDKKAISNQFVPKVQEFWFAANGSLMSSVAVGVLRWGTLNTQGSGVVNYDDSNGRFIALVKCEVNLSVSLFQTVSHSELIRVNGTNRMFLAESANERNTGGLNVILNPGDYIDINALNGLSTAQAQSISMVCRETL